ncbi:putative reverse transcriptase domain-containing protein [Tanacetum coccineum]
MPPRIFKKKSVKRIVEKKALFVAKAMKNIKRQDLTQTMLVDLDQQILGDVAPEAMGSFMEQVFEICKCAEDDKVKFAMCTFEGRALTWMEQELWTLTLKGDDIEAYNNRFHELVLMCPELVSTEKKKIEKYIRGFLEGIKGKNVNTSKLRLCMMQSHGVRELIEGSIEVAAQKEQEKKCGYYPLCQVSLGDH